MTAQDKITKAKVKLVLEQPFFATLALKMKYVEDQSIRTARTDGSSIRFNPEFIESLSDDMVKTLIAHEVLHPALLHHTRIEDRDPKRWNMAADYAINPILKHAGFELPEGGLIDDRFNNMSAENIYTALETEEEENNNKGDNGGDNKEKSDPNKEGFGEVEKGNAETESEIQQVEAEMKQALAQAAQVAKQAGKLPAGIQRIVDDLLKPVITWEEVLNRFASEVVRNDYTWKKPNRRYIQSGLYLPALENEEKGKIALIVDTSGSIDEDIMRRFCTEMASISTIMSIPVTVIYVDTKVEGVEEMIDGEPLHPVGGGGTRFEPGFTYIEESGEDVKGIIYLTDGYCYSFPSVPDTPTLWAVYSRDNFDPPFGEVIYIKDVQIEV